MLIKDIFGQKRTPVSFEIFPPKKDQELIALDDTLCRMAALSPAFVSVTCGAGGSGVTGATADIAEIIQKKHAMTAVAHMTCVAAHRGTVQKALEDCRARGIDNILALRGDLPQEGRLARADYVYAADLMREIRGFGGFCVGGACYPEGHIDCENAALEIEYMKYKEAAGAEFFISQLFFDNEAFLRLWERARAHGITRPVTAGIMPILGRSQIEKMIFMCGASLPSRVIKLLHKYEKSPADLRRAGIEMAARQIEELLREGVDGVHIYTMNKADIAEGCYPYGTAQG